MTYKPLTHEEAYNLVGKGATVTAYNGGTPIVGPIPHATGRLIAYSVEPQVLIEDEQGKKTWWRRDMVALTPEPKFIVGQRVVGNDYARLPIGSVVLEEEADDTVRSVPLAKTGEDEWTNQGWPGVFASVDLSYDERRLTHLGGGTWVKVPDDADDVYVEPEPLKEGDWCLVWAQILPNGAAMAQGWDEHVSIGGTQAKAYVRRDAIISTPDTPPWVKPAQCTSLWEASPNDYARCIKDEHDDTEPHNRPGIFWTDAEAYGRVEVSS